MHPLRRPHNTGKTRGVELLDRDRRHCWHPFTQAATAPEPLPVVAAEGAWLTLADGRRIFDGLSSWWSTLHGHGHPHLVKAIAEQAARLDHVLFAGCTHPPAVELASRLCAAMSSPAADTTSLTTADTPDHATPDTPSHTTADTSHAKTSSPSARASSRLTRVFYSDDGSTAVEVALKMAFQLHINRGEPERRHFICLQGGYHGDTIGAMSAGDPGTFGEPFEPLLFPVTRVRPALTEAHSEPHTTEQALAELDRAMAQHAGQIAAVVIEPMVQGAAGMRIMPPAYLRGLRERCDEHGALLIADEVMTAFGRTGRMLALEHAGIHADLVCLSKGISGGTLPLAATLTPEWIYEVFLDEDMRRGFLHGHTYTANPIACAAALASLDVFERERSLDRAAALERFYAERLPQLASHPKVAHVRWLGSIGVVELSDGSSSYYNPIGPRVGAAMLQRGYLIRPLGPVVYTLPPLCTTQDEIAAVYDHLEAVLNEL